MKVPGFYLFTKKKAVIPMDIFKRPGQEASMMYDVEV